jgi:hypothetical protein
MTMAKRKRFELRLSEDQLTAMKRTAQARGFRSATAYVNETLAKDLRDSRSEQPDRQAFVAASIDRLSKEIRTLHTAHQALFALVDSLTRLFLTCIPEPPTGALDEAKRRAKLRYSRFMVSVAQNMSSDTRATLSELIDRV